MPTPSRLLSPRNDVVFKLLFTREPILLRSMLEAVLDQPIDDVTVLNPGLPGDLSGDKNIVLDIRVLLPSGTRVDVEMQVRVTPELRSRLVYYAARDYAQQLSRGEPFDILSPTLLVVWLDQPLQPGSHRFHRIFELRDRLSGELFSDHLALHVLQLRDWNRSSEAPSAPERTTLRRWARFLAADTSEQLTDLAREDPIMARAADSLEQISQDPENARMAREREDSVKFYQIGLAMSRGEGLAEGLQKGIAEGLQKGIAEGLQKGAAEGAAQSIVQVCQALHIPMDPARQTMLQGTSEELRQLLDYLLLHRAWPSG